MTMNISAHIPDDLAHKLEKISQFEGRSKSYYIKKGLTELLEQKFQDMQDLESAKKTLAEARQQQDGFVSLEEVFKDVE